MMMPLKFFHEGKTLPRDRIKFGMFFFNPCIYISGSWLSIFLHQVESSDRF